MTEETPKHLIINTQTGEETIVDFTPEEIAALEEAKLASEQARAEREAAAELEAAAKASAQAKLAALGLTAEEIAALSSK